MAKSKKSKILAMALCASVMTGIYASPVMAAGQISGITLADGSTTLVANDQIFINGVELSGDAVKATGGNFTQLTVTNGMEITGGVLTVGSTTIDSTNGNTVVGGTLTANGIANLNGGLSVSGGATVNGGLTVNDTATVNGMLTASDGLTVTNNGIKVEEGGLTVEMGDTVLNDLSAGTTTLDRLTVTDGQAEFKQGAFVEGQLYADQAKVGAAGLEVVGDTTLKSTLKVDGQTTLNGLTAGATDVDSLDVTNNATVGGTLNVTGDTTLAGLTAGATTVDSLTVNGAAKVNSLEVDNSATVGDKLTVGNGLDVTGNALLNNDLTVNGATKLNGDVTVGGEAKFNEKATFNGKAIFNENIDVNGFANLNSGAKVNGELTVNGATKVNDDLTVNGDALVNGSLDISNGKFKVDADGNTEFIGNLNINHGNFTVDAVTGNTVVKGSLELGSLDGREVGQAIKDLEAYAGDLKDANLPDKVGGIERDPADAGDPGNGTTTIENGAEFTGTAMTMGDTIVESGKITVGAADNQTVIEGGAITAESLTLASLDDREVGAVVNALEQKTAGIERNDVTETTTIEGVTSFDANGMSIKDAEGFGTSLGVAGMEITATGGLSTSFTAGGATFVGVSGTTTINGGAIETSTINGVNFSEWHDEVDGRLDVLEDKTQNIKPGAGTGEGGTAAGESNNIIEVPATEDGHTGINGNVTVGGEINAGAGNIGGVGMEEGTITAGDGNFTGDVDITGDINAGTGNIGGVGMEEGTITTGDTAIDGSGITTGNGNFTGNVDIIGDITAGTGNIGGVGMEEGTITTGDTTIDGDGMTVGGEEGTSIKHDEISVGDGGYIGGGDVVSGEGVSLNQTAERVGHLENRVGELEDRVDKVGAMSAAIANLRTMGYDPAAPTEVAVGIGQYRDETGAALGLFHYPNRDFMLSLSVSTAGDEVMGGIGATQKFGRKSPEKVAEIKKAQAEADARRAEEAKLAKAEEMKQAAKEAKIKAQQERHAKLAAERAAQAEAAK